MDPARVTDAPPRAAKGVAGLLKNKPPVFYVVLIAGVLAAAWLIRKREAAQAPADPTATTQTGDGSFSPDYTPTDGALAGGYGSGAVDQTGAYAGGPIPLGNGYIWDPGTGSIYGALPDAPADPTTPLVPSVPAGTGGGPPNNGGVEQHYPPGTPVWMPGPVAPSPLPIPQGGSSTTLHECGGRYPNSSERGCYRVVRIASGTHRGKWHYYAPADSPKIKVSDNPNA